MNYSKLSKKQAQEVIAKATLRVKEIDFLTVDRIIQRMQFDYPTNGAGGTGSECVDIDYTNQVVNVELRAYGCNYNQPYFENEDEIRAALKKIGYTLEIETTDD